MSMQSGFTSKLVAFPPKGLCCLQADLHCQFPPGLSRSIEDDILASLRVEVRPAAAFCASFSLCPFAPRLRVLCAFM